MAKSIIQLVDELPADNITVKVLKALDFVAPGQWSNMVGFDQTVIALTGDSDPKVLSRVRDRAAALYEDPSQGYKGAIGLYQTVDKADVAMATAALANKVGEKISVLSFLSSITPKADTTQTVDLLLKIAVEVLAFCKLNGIPQPNPQAFVAALQQNYSDAALMRMVALVCIDGLLPLGPNFLGKIHETLKGLDLSSITGNPVFSGIKGDLPGGGTEEKVGFLTQSFGSVEGWVSGFVDRTNITPQRISGGIGRFIDIADDNLDFIAAFLDQTTNYFEHTGIQTVARHLILAVYPQVKTELAAEAEAKAQAQAAAPSGQPGQYSIGQTVEGWDEDEEDWYEASVLKVREKKGKTQYFLHYAGYGASEEEWVWAEDVRVRDLDNSDQQGYSLGQTVKVWDDEEEEWYSATIQEIRGKQYFVHYWDDDAGEDDEWLNLDDIT
ncbi:Tudor-knot domain-containing protein [Prochlorothrix hollandica]|uniref:Tudor protein n=1 Tax=Prochlorothrix hollandica PCC 9006 = CALU 1027 TaxID=317619 RepID=A0A0M2PXU2_PROHO|nr:Tudor-knot domain-containing protein [Prochlorothrix hollandica]KKJ00990.1 Tudor protein [Prochlorothrix hollandica PCC 9006 = CALU 1027]